MFASIALITGFGILFFGLILLAILIFEIWMFISVITNERLTTETKLLWVIGMVLLHPFIAIWYYFAEHRRN